MKSPRCIVLALSAALAVGCSASVDTTDDAAEIKVQVPKIETGDAPLDADPSTDRDLDVDTPAPGDS